MPMANAATTGRKVPVVAVLLVSSVKNAMSVVITTTSTIVPASPRTMRLFPIQSARPVRVIEEARLSPPPNRSKRPHGSFGMVSHFMRYGSSDWPLGMRKRVMAAIIAIPASDSPDNPGKVFSKGRVIHVNAAIANTTDTRFSEILIGPRSARISVNTRRVSGEVTKFTGNTIRVSANHERGSIQIVSGKPTSINCPNPISPKPLSFMKPAKSAFGAVPTSVDIPPMVAL